MLGITESAIDSRAACCARVHVARIVAADQAEWTRSSFLQHARPGNHNWLVTPQQLPKSVDGSVPDLATTGGEQRAAFVLLADGGPVSSCYVVLGVP